MMIDVVINHRPRMYECVVDKEITGLSDRNIRALIQAAIEERGPVTLVSGRGEKTVFFPQGHTYVDNFYAVYIYEPTSFAMVAQPDNFIKFGKWMHMRNTYAEMDGELKHVA